MEFVKNRSLFGSRIAPGSFTFALCEGMTIQSGLVRGGMALLGVQEMKVSASHGGMWGWESRSRRHGRERFLWGLGLVRFRQLSGAGARDFGVRLLTARQCGPPTFFHKFLLPP